MLGFLQICLFVLRLNLGSCACNLPAPKGESLLYHWTPWVLKLAHYTSSKEIMYKWRRILLCLHVKLSLFLHSRGLTKDSLKINFLPVDLQSLACPAVPDFLYSSVSLATLVLAEVLTRCPLLFLSEMGSSLRCLSFERIQTC